MTTKPHDSFKYIRADEVAETWEGVSEDLYATLWNKIVPAMKPLPNMEDTGPYDHVGTENLASHWKLLTEAERKELNALAVKVDAEWKELLGDMED